MKTVFGAVIGAATLAASAHADLVGWTANVRSVSGGYLVNVYAVVGSSTDSLLNVIGGSLGQPGAGYILTTSAGGFLQGAGSAATFAPVGGQSWTTLDSFLTVGGNYVPASNAWTANSGTVGDPPWNVTYMDIDAGTPVTVNAFNTPSDDTGFVNRFTDNIPETAGWFLTGTSSQARDLSVLTGRSYSSSAAAASGNAGVMVAQLFVSELSMPGSGTAGKVIEWNMGATVRRSNGSTASATFAFVIGEVPAPGSLAILALAAGTARRRRSDIPRPARPQPRTAPRA